MRSGKRNKNNLNALLLLFVFSEICLAQQFPLWFLRPGDINCNNLVVGYAKRSYYEDTAAVKKAELNAALNYTKLSDITIAGDQNFWLTAIGNAWMGSSYKEIYDSHYVSKVAEVLNIIDIHKLDGYLILLASTDECDISDVEKKLVSVYEYPKPDWMDILPDDGIYSYAVGSSEIYYYPETAWIKAEENARLNLARSLNTKIKAVQKFSSIENQAIVSESTSVKLNNIEIKGRWVNDKLKVNYVLVRCKKFSERIE